MKKYHIALVAFIIIIFIYLFMRFRYRKSYLNNLIKNMNVEQNKTECEECTNIETFGNTKESEYEKYKQNEGINIVSVGKDYIKQPLKEYVIKSSYNSAITGEYVNKDMVSNLLERGCRFLDFEVLMEEGIPIVTYTTDPNLELFNTNNTETLYDILNVVITKSFAKPSPNYEDPIFVNLRIKSNDASIYNRIAIDISRTLKSRLFNGKITKDTTLSEVMGKVVLVVDKTINRNYAEDSVCKNKTDQDCKDLTKMVNLESGSDICHLNTYTNVMNRPKKTIRVKDDCNLCTDIEKIQMVIPDLINDNTENPHMYELVNNYGCQIITQRYYINDAGLTNYEEFFNKNKCGIIPLSLAIDYLYKQQFE
tara:strand:+ start:22322 stop:23419 length:1098 start_codon:yes stop_codon:yes gene_type:complete